MARSTPRGRQIHCPKAPCRESLNVGPRLAVNHRIHRMRGASDLARNRLPLSPVCGFRSDTTNIGLGKARIPTAFAARVPSLRARVIVVFFRRAKKQVSRVATRASVAPVKHVQTFARTVNQLERVGMRPDVRARRMRAVGELAIAIFVFRAHPDPTSVRACALVDARPETSLYPFWGTRARKRTTCSELYISLCCSLKFPTARSAMKYSSHACLPFEVSHTPGRANVAGVFDLARTIADRNEGSRGR